MGAPTVSTAVDMQQITEVNSRGKTNCQWGKRKLFRYILFNWNWNRGKIGGLSATPIAICSVD